MPSWSDHDDGLGPPTFDPDTVKVPEPYTETEWAGTEGYTGECAECGHLHWHGRERGYSTCPVEECECEGQPVTTAVQVSIDLQGWAQVDPGPFIDGWYNR